MKAQHNIENFHADWPAPGNVKTLITSRKHGGSRAPFDTLNLGFHVGDDPKQVEENWQLIADQKQIPQKPCLLSQIHSTRVLEHPLNIPEPLTLQGDGIYTRQPNTPCMILTADCLPILLCDETGSQVAALHVGWRGLAAGIINQGVKSFSHPHRVMAYLGPAICRQCFEVGGEVREMFLQKFTPYSSKKAVEHCFIPSSRDNNEKHWLADLKQLAQLNLQALGVNQIYKDLYCTVEQPELFYSFRRDGVTGRFASMIWLEA